MRELNLVKLQVFDIREDGEALDRKPKYYALDDNKLNIMKLKVKEMNSTKIIAELKVKGKIYVQD